MYVPQLEICAETAQACVAAFEGGANRIEICSALSEGGVTPSHGLIRQAIERARGLPVYVLIRPRSGDFVYSDQEFKIMCADAEHALHLGAAGIVTGILTRQRSVNASRTRGLIRLAAGREVTFHRAFDHAQNLNEALEQIIDLGCDRLLTSGGKPSVAEGLRMVVQLAEQARGRIRIAAGGGITPELAQTLTPMHVDVHASLQPKTIDPLWDHAAGPTEVSAERVRELASIVRASHRPGLCAPS